MGYRFRVRLQTDGQGQIGFLRRRSRTVVPVDQCPVLADGLNDILDRLGNSRRLLPTNGEISLALGDRGAVASVKGVLRGSLRDLLRETGLCGCDVQGEPLEVTPFCVSPSPG